MAAELSDRRPHLGQYLLANQPRGKIAILYQNDEYGKDYMKGLKDALAGAIPIVAEASYETSDANLNTQMAKLKTSGADMFFDVATPKFAVMAIKRGGRDRLEAAALRQQRVELGRLGDQAGRLRECRRASSPPTT